MKRPSVAIVGRPNVGKSSLLNALCGQRISIVDPTPGVTRDRVAAVVQHEGRTFELVDTGGIGIVDRADLADHVEQQINAAVVAADLVIFLVDVQEGLTGLDREAADFLRRSGKPILLVANKVDHEKHEPARERVLRARARAADASSRRSSRSASPIFATRSSRDCPERDEGESATDEGLLKVAIVGQRNAGKSTLLNALLGEERMIVSEVPGTTRDSVDVRVTMGGRTFLAIDTAGARKGSRVEDSIEFYSQVRSERAVERADVVILLIDATKEVSQVDKMVADWILTGRKCCVIAVNKWDLATTHRHAQLPQVPGDAPAAPPLRAGRVPVGEGPGACGRAVQNRVRGLRSGLHARRHADVNRVIEKAMEVRGPRLAKGRYPKVFYGTQVGINPRGSCCS